MAIAGPPGKRTSIYTDHSLLSTTVSFSPDGRWIAGGQRGPFGTDQVGECRVWELDSGREIYRFAGHPGGINAVRFSPDGKFIATGGVVHRDEKRTGGLKVWRVQDGQLHFADDQADVYALSFAPDSENACHWRYKEIVLKSIL